MKFEKYLCGVALNEWQVAKYSDGEKVRLVCEHTSKPDSGQRTFESVAEYEKWIDELVDDETGIYNRARALNIVLTALGD